METILSDRGADENEQRADRFVPTQRFVEKCHADDDRKDRCEVGDAAGDGGGGVAHYMEVQNVRRTSSQNPEGGEGQQ